MMKFASVRLIAADIEAMVAFYEMVTGQAADWLAPQFAGNCSRGRAAVQAGTAIGWPRSVRRMALMARTERRRAVSMTDLMSA